MVGFDLGSVPLNADGWGPPDSSISVPSQISNAPFAPFSRPDKLGRIADWTRSISNRPGSNSKQSPTDSAFDFSGDDSFATLAADEDSSFRLVDTAAKSHHNQHRPKFNPRWRFNPHHNRSQLPQRRDEEVEAKKREQEKERARRDRLYNLNRSGTNAGQRRESAFFKSSVDIQPEWNMLDQIPFSTFSKLSFAVQEPEDLLICGGLEFYDRSYDRITDDPVIRRLAKEDKATVFATDTILSTLMCSPRSVYSWDIVVQRVE